jgi:hypothetical protein
MRRVALLEHLLLVAGVLPSLVSGFSRPLAVIPKMQLQKATVPKTIVITGEGSDLCFVLSIAFYHLFQP